MKTKYSGSVDAQRGHRGCCLVSRIGPTQIAKGKRETRAKPREGASTIVTAVVDSLRQPLSAARVAAPSREETARKTRFRIARSVRSTDIHPLR